MAEYNKETQRLVFLGEPYEPVFLEYDDRMRERLEAIEMIERNFGDLIDHPFSSNLRHLVDHMRVSGQPLDLYPDWAPLSFTWKGMFFGGLIFHGNGPDPLSVTLTGPREGKRCMWSTHT